MLLRIEVFIDLKLEKLAPFSQPISTFPGLTRTQAVVLSKAFGCRPVGMDATENAY